MDYASLFDVNKGWEMPHTFHSHTMLPVTHAPSVYIRFAKWCGEAKRMYTEGVRSVGVTPRRMKWWVASHGVSSLGCAPTLQG